MKPTIPTWHELAPVMPEVWLIIAMCAVLLVPFIKRHSVMLPVVTTLVGLVLAMASALVSLDALSAEVGGGAGSGGGRMFSAALTIDPFSQFFKMLLLIFTIFIVVLWLLTSRHETDVRDVPDYMCLLLGATLGMTLMVSANNLLMIFIAMETASFPSFALAGFRKRHRLSTEGSLKYVLFGAAASAVGLYGMSLVYGSAGSLDLAMIAQAASPTVADGAVTGGITPLMAVGLMAMFSSFAFKLSAAPVHFWCPDVFQGAPIEVTTFLSVASKGAAICMVLRVLTAFNDAGNTAALAIERALAINVSPMMALTVGVAILGGVTATWGNLLAMHQTNIKRLLAYSSIAHAGYMIMAVSLVTIAPNGDAVQALTGAILFYLLIYMFMNLGAFTVAALLAQQIGSEDIRDYAGLVRRSPAIAVLMILFLLSLFGMPGLGGFMGKIYLGMAMFDAGQTVAFLLIIVLLINTVISLYYYMRPVYYIAFIADEPARPVFVPQAAGLLLTVICAVALLFTGLLPQRAGQLARDYGTVIVHHSASPVQQQAAANDKDDAP